MYDTERYLDPFLMKNIPQALNKMSSFNNMDIHTMLY